MEAEGPAALQQAPSQPLLIPSLPGKDGLFHPTVPLGDAQVRGEQWAVWDRGCAGGSRLCRAAQDAERSDGAALVAFPAAHGHAAVACIGWLSVLIHDSLQSKCRV